MPFVQGADETSVEEPKVPKYYLTIHQLDVQIGSKEEPKKEVDPTDLQNLYNNLKNKGLTLLDLERIFTFFKTILEQVNWQDMAVTGEDDRARAESVYATVKEEVDEFADYTRSFSETLLNDLPWLRENLKKRTQKNKFVEHVYLKAIGRACLEYRKEGVAERFEQDVRRVLAANKEAISEAALPFPYNSLTELSK